MFNDLQFLKIDLPEDILKLKCNGDFDKAIKLIDIKLKKDIPVALKKRLELEKEIISVIKGEYPYSFEQALELLQKNIKDFKEKELIELQEENAVDWIFINGKEYFIESFYDNLIITKQEIACRQIEIVNSESDKKKQQLLDDNVKRMKENQNIAYHFCVRASLKIKEESARLDKTVKVYLPVPNNAQQVKNVKIIKTEPKSKFIAPFNFPIRTVYFEEELKPNQEFMVEYSYETHMKYIEPDPVEVSEIQPSFNTDELAPHIMFSPYIKELYKEIVGIEKNPLIKARKIYDFITTKIKYSYVRKYFTILNISEYAALNMKGDCGVQAILFITLCRYGGIPAKWQSGLYVTPYNVGGHDWAQFYIEPYGWLFADLSFGGSAYRKGKMDRWNFYFGNLDPFRMPANSEFQNELEPPKRHLRYDPYDNQYGECEYEDRGLRREEYITNNILVDMKEIRFEK